MAIGITLRLYDGAVAKTSITGITAHWWDTTTVSDFKTSVGVTTSAATDGSGDLVLDLSDVSTLVLNEWGFLLLYKLDGGDYKDSPMFAGRVQVSTVTAATKFVLNADFEQILIASTALGAL